MAAPTGGPTLRSLVARELHEVVNDFAVAAADFVGDIRDSWWDAERLVRVPAARRAFGPVIFAATVAIIVVIASTMGALINLVFDLLGATIDLLVSLVGVAIAATVAVLLGLLFRSAAVRLGVFRALAGPVVAVGNALNLGATLSGETVQGSVDRGVWLLVRAYRRTRCEVGDRVVRIRRAVARNVLKISKDDPAAGTPRIDHFIVLMLENRSFDHLLGQSRTWDGLIPPQPMFSNLCEGEVVPAGGDARPTLRVDPPHEFSGVAQQLQGSATAPNSGFVSAYRDHMIAAGNGAASPGDCRGQLMEDPREVMRGFSEETLPVLYALAREFAVCDRWFSSIPGPTLPNRLFAMAGTSGGLADSPSTASFARAIVQGGFRFSGGTLFEQLSDLCIPWRIYAGSFPPMSMVLRGVVEDQAFAGWPLARSLGRLANDLEHADASFPSFVFIEPDYGPLLGGPDYSKGNSQHPLNGVSAGEALIKETYEALRRSAIWSSSVLLIVYDEHGGFYDHGIPPSAVPPGDGERYREWQSDVAARSFAFDRLGVRVPAVVVSPLVAKGTVDSLTRDHTSIIATIADAFGISRLTARGKAAMSLANVLTLTSPRDTPPSLPSSFYPPAEANGE